MKLLRLIPFIAALGVLMSGVVAAAGNSPYGVSGGAGTFAQLPGNGTITFTAAPTGSSATLASNWTGTATSILVVFSDWESRTVTVANGATTASWTGALVGTPTATATIDGLTATPGAPTFGFTSDLGAVYSNGTNWFAASMGPSGAPVYISSGCATVSSTKGSATAMQFATTATTCTPVVQLPPAPNGWACVGIDVTHPVVFTETAQTTYSCTVTGTTTSGDIVQVFATPY